MSVEIKHSNIDLLKMKHQQTYSESLFGISYAPDFQCPNINGIIKAIATIEKLSSKTDRLDEDELRDALSDINSEVWGLERDIENVRKACEEIREWGQAWKDEFKKFVNESVIDIDNFI